MCSSYQVLDAFVLEELREVRRESFYCVAALSINQVLQAGQTASEVVVGIAGNIHVSQCEVHPWKTNKTHHCFSISCSAEARCSRGGPLLEVL